MIGSKRGTVLLCDHCEEWEMEANRTISTLKTILGDFAIDIQHIGSTSIKNIKAKPIIDIAIGVNSFDDLDKYLEALLKNGIYKSSGQPFSDIILFSKDDENGNRINNIQVVIYGKEHWNKHILFRDYMNKHSSKAAEYDRIKIEASVLYPKDVLAYSNYKSAFINKCIDEAQDEITMKKYYEAYDERYKAVHEKNLRCMGYECSAIVTEIINKFGIRRDNSILEIGCGEGRDSIVLLKNGYNLLATDVSAQAINYCKEQYKEFADHFQMLDAVNGVHDEKYDLIYSVAVIHMLVPDEDRNLFCSFIKEHLNENGIALICTMGDGKTERMTDISKAFDMSERTFEGSTMLVAETSCRIVTFDTFEKELKDAHFQIIEKGLTSIGTQFPSMMYAVVKRM